MLEIQVFGKLIKKFKLIDKKNILNIIVSN